MQGTAANFHKLRPIIATLLVLLSACGNADNRLFEEIVEQAYPVEPDANITIQNRDGAVMIYGSDTKELRVRAVKKAYSRDRLSQIIIEVSRRPGSVSVITKFPPRPNWAFSDRSGTVDCTILVPATASISALDLNAGEVFLDSMRGHELHARLGDGRMVARNCFTKLHLTTNRGTLTLSVRLVGEGRVFGPGKRRRGQRPGLFTDRRRLPPLRPRRAWKNRQRFH